jgi:hypothetical protein
MLLWHASFHDAWRTLVSGDAERAEHLATIALDKGTRAGVPDAFDIYANQLMCVRWHQGRLGEVLEVLLQATRDNPGIPAYQAAYGLALFEMGDTDDARRLLLEHARAGFAAYQPDNLWLAGMTLWGNVAGELGEVDAAAVLLDQLGDYGDQVATTGASVMGPVAHALGGLYRARGDLDNAVHWLVRAREICTGMDAPFFLARADLQLARVLQDGADAPGLTAPGLVDEAAELAERFGCPQVLGRANELRAAL